MDIIKKLASSLLEIADLKINTSTKNHDVSTSPRSSDLQVSFLN